MLCVSFSNDISIDKQAVTMAEELRKDVVQFAKNVSPEEFAAQINAADPHIVHQQI
jgi:hypothetical protein